MRVGIATDHGGFGLKEEWVAHLRKVGHEVIDFGAHGLTRAMTLPILSSPSLRLWQREKWIEAWRFAAAAQFRRKRLYSIPEAGEYLGRTAWAVRHLIWNGILPSVRIGRRVQVDVSDLDLLIERNKSRDR